MFEAEFNPYMQSPLQHFNLAARAEPFNASKGVWISEKSLLGYISLRGDAENAAFVEAANRALGTKLPTQPCGLQYTSWGAVLWLSPDEWLLICERAQREDLQSALTHALTGIHSQVVDNSGGYTSVLLKGERASDVLQHCTVYDLNALTSDKVVGTTFGKLSLYLYREGEGYCLLFRRSFADYIWRYLERSAEPYGLSIVAGA